MGGLAARLGIYAGVLALTTRRQAAVEADAEAVGRIGGTPAFADTLAAVRRREFYLAQATTTE